MSEAKKTYHEEFAEEVIRRLEAGTTPWQKPWEPGAHDSPQNPVSGTVYKGGNKVWLSMRQPDNDPRWMTYAQAQEAGAQVRKGEKGTTIAFWQWTKQVLEKDANGQPVLDENGMEKQVNIQLERPFVRYSTVFHASQIDGLTPYVPKEITWQPVERGENILAGSGASIRHDQADRAFYRPGTDTIHLPSKEQFPAAEKYYATALHELGHWTGHPDRMARDFGPFGSEPYAKEELRAEISSWMIGSETGLGHDPGQHAAYTKSWIKALRDDPYEIVRACRDAEHIKDYLLAREVELQKEKQQTAPEKTPLNESYAEKDLAKEAGAHRDGGARQWLAQKLQAWLSGQEKETAAPATVEVPKVTKKTYLNVPYAEKGLAKEAGARWDSGARLWFAPEGTDMEKLQVWLPGQEKETAVPATAEVRNPVTTEVPKVTEKTYLNVPYAEKDLAKEAGARWDKDAKLWFAPEGANHEGLRAWLPDRTPEPVVKLDPQREFGKALADMGLDLGGNPPIMDGHIHRVPVLDGKSDNRDGAYCGYQDGHPAGWGQNYKTGEKSNWKASTGHKLDSTAQAAQRQQMLANREKRQAEIAAEHDRVAATCREIWQARANAPDDHSYLQSKGVPALGLKLSQGGDVLVPLRNIDGDLRGLQAISPTGDKQFMPGSEKKSCFHLIGEEKKDFSKEEIILAEGYATGASLHLATGKPVAIAFDAGNLEAVAKKLREKYPEAKITIAADNDHAKQRNIGVESAKKAAQEVGGTVKIPIFTQAEKGRGLTDFNDLHKSRGIAEVKKQMGISRQSEMER